MLFCPKCGSIMTPDKNKGVLVCSCGYEHKNNKDSKLKENIDNKKEVDVIEKEIDPSPEVEAECPKCGHNKAKFWTVQTRASDEPETKFFKCLKCNHTWRDYD
ncbi:MAG: transcription factor S [Nanobdellota archaeon]